MGVRLIDLQCCHNTNIYSHNTDDGTTQQLLMALMGMDGWIDADIGGGMKGVIAFNWPFVSV
jgi:hypothetical protein